MDFKTICVPNWYEKRCKLSNYWYSINKTESHSDPWPQINIFQFFLFQFFLSFKSFQIFSNLFKSFYIFSNLFKSFQILSNIFKSFQIFSIPFNSCYLLVNSCQFCQFLLNLFNFVMNWQMQRTTSLSVMTKHVWIHDRNCKSSEKRALSAVAF